MGCSDRWISLCLEVIHSAIWISGFQNLKNKQPELRPSKISTIAEFFALTLIIFSCLRFKQTHRRKEHAMVKSLTRPIRLGLSGLNYLYTNNHLESENHQRSWRLLTNLWGDSSASKFPARDIKAYNLPTTRRVELVMTCRTSPFCITTPDI